uniref:Uncharacterized protein n=1 Tax=Anguilla anguilla TaxID=7936 RepID=A0A0E9XHT2_ANGAN
MNSAVSDTFLHVLEGPSLFSSLHDYEECSMFLCALEDLRATLFCVVLVWHISQPHSYVPLAYVHVALGKTGIFLVGQLLKIFRLVLSFQTQ